MILDPFAGPGGWSEGLRSLGLADLGIEWDADAWQRHGYEAQFIPQPRTWLAQARWDDELPGPRAGPAVASRTTRNHQRLAASLARMQGAQA